MKRKLAIFFGGGGKTSVFSLKVFDALTDLTLAIYGTLS